MCKWAIFHMLSEGSQVVGMIKLFPVVLRKYIEDADFAWGT